MYVLKKCIDIEILKEVSIEGLLLIPLLDYVAGVSLYKV
jgi:hypothetical protein